MTDGLVALSPEEKRARLAEMLRRKASEPRRAPLSLAQERLWILHHLTPGRSVYNLPIALRITGPFEPAVGERVCREIVRRHEILRTTFPNEEGRPIQLIAPVPILSLSVVDLEGLPAERREAEALRLVAEDARRPFDITQEPPVRAMLVRLGSADHVFAGTLHHIAADGPSIAVIQRELMALYASFSAGAASPLPDPPVQYADFAAWQARQLASGALESQLGFWTSRLAGALPVLELPADRPRPAIKSHRGAVHHFALAPELAADLRAFVRREGVTPFMALLAAFQAVLHRYTGQHDILVGSPVSGRAGAALEGLIGCFVNTLVLRTDLSGDPTFREALGRARDVALAAYAHADLPFERLVQALGPERDPSHTPLFQVMFALFSLPEPGPFFNRLEVHSGSAQVDLLLEMVEGPDGFRGWLEYDTDLFDAATVARLAEHFETLLAGALAEPECRLSRLPLLTETERVERRAWNATGVERPADACLHELVEAQAGRTPDAVAVVFEGEALTYRELERRAAALADRLRDLGVGPDVKVGIAMARSLDLVVALLGVLKAGGAYVPLDPEQPRERLALIAGAAGLGALVADHALAEALPVLAVPTVRLGATGPEGEPVTVPRPSARPDHLAYVIFTSGSTGTPRGVMVSHRAVCNRLLWMQEAYALTPADRVLHKTSIGFDVSVWEIFWPLVAGATLVLARPGGQRNPPYLARLVAAHGVTVAHFVPSMLRAFLDQPDLAAACRTLRHVVCSGEVLAPELSERFLARLDAGLHNLYGPTEAAIDVTAWECVPSDDARTVPIGRPIANTRIHLVDRGMEHVPTGHPGEICIAGVALARGYAGRPDLTAERFVPDPFGEPGARLYRTGDLGRYRPDGSIEFLGRLDRQVKIRGVRIELGEVEAALTRHRSLREALVVAREDAAGEPRLVAYLVAAEVPPPSGAELRAALRQRLPDSMVPTAFVWMPSLPLTPNGKVDHRALPAPGRPDLGSAPVAPATALERELAGIWRRVLDVGDIGIHDNFFDLGGASIQCLRVAALAMEAGLPMSPEMLFEHQTIGELAAALETR